jgi:hypothetical protein
MRPFVIGSNVVERVTNYKLLGVQLSGDLSGINMLIISTKKLVRSYIPSAYFVELALSKGIY